MLYCKVFLRKPHTKHASRSKARIFYGQSSCRNAPAVTANHLSSIQDQKAHSGKIWKLDTSTQIGNPKTSRTTFMKIVTEHVKVEAEAGPSKPALSLPQNFTRLSIELHRRGATYVLVNRGRKSLIYARTVPGQDTTYEVFEIRIRKASTIKGKTVVSSEIFPHDEAFGNWAWAPWTLERAMEYFNKIETGLM